MADPRDEARAKAVKAQAEARKVTMGDMLRASAWMQKCIDGDGLDAETACALLAAEFAELRAEMIPGLVYDREEIDQLRAEVSRLAAENARLRAFERECVRHAQNRDKGDLMSYVEEHIENKDRGFVRQRCSTCGLACDGSTITRERAETYDKRCPKCGTDTMAVTAWVPTP